MTLANQYRFLGQHPNESQEAGFFVDHDDTVIFWPSKQAPGYRLSLIDALKLAWAPLNDPNKVDDLFSPSNETERKAEKFRVLKWFLGSIAMMVVYMAAAAAFIPISERIAELVPTLFSPAGIVFGTLLPLSFVFPVIAGFFQTRTAKKDVIHRLHSFKTELVNQPCPTPIVIHPAYDDVSITDGDPSLTKFWLERAPFIVAPAGILIFALINDLLPGDRVVALAAAAWFSWILAPMTWAGIIGVRKRDVTFLDPMTHAAAVNHIRITLKENSGDNPN
ncbi:hypothetical protein HH303_17455 [Rhodospirillaceae bacterium KN72]|uniref:Uncharacterized protein n=1 Tax=Pacificispira spongiicola TaxID=2729598 RepID=A0A7Y0HFW9_9PROT|nr:hypothetical protein [Pacificispira spongiicola]NMM46281.1 hypothetical protein [Pacificispira spongiicola]